MNKNDEIEKISAYLRNAKRLALDGQYEGSVEEYKKGLLLLSTDKLKEEYSLMFFSGIGEAYFLNKQWEKALEYYKQAVFSDGGLGEPLIHLRLGEIRFELGDLTKAQDELMRAYMGGATFIFEGEDPKYFQAIENLI